MQEYKQIILGEVALYYVKKHLSHGLTLTKYVRVNVDLDAGQVIVGFPENANLKEINNFESGGFLPTAPEEDWVHLGRDGKKSTMVYRYFITSILNRITTKKLKTQLIESYYL